MEKQQNKSYAFACQVFLQQQKFILKTMKKSAVKKKTGLIREEFIKVEPKKYQYERI